MQRKIITTADGSKTIQIEGWNEQYHSLHGAIQEANHVYITQGLLFYFDLIDSSKFDVEKTSSAISVLEIGFGTGLNAFLTLLQAEGQKRKIRYVGVDAYPISTAEMEALNYVDVLHLPNKTSLFEEMHRVTWALDHSLTSCFTLQKQQKFFKDISYTDQFDLIYFDAFGARVQPELWTTSIFKLMFEALKPGGVLVTYAAKGSVRRAMLAVGFSVEKLPGPPGKREMLRARKT